MRNVSCQHIENLSSENVTYTSIPDNFMSRGESEKKIIFFYSMTFHSLFKK